MSQTFSLKIQIVSVQYHNTTAPKWFLLCRKYLPNQEQMMTEQNGTIYYLKLKVCHNSNLIKIEN